MLRRIGLYQRAKSSMAYDFYWGLAKPEMLREREAEVSFFRNLLTGFRPGDLIMDVGANIGHKTDIFLRLGARVVAVDPDLSNQEILRQSFHGLRLRKRPVTIVGKAVSDRTGSETMWVDKPGSAKNTLNSKWVETLRADATRFGETLDFKSQREVQTATLMDLIAEHGLPIYIKIDVEGHEPAVLRGLRRPVPFISFEVNLPEFKPEAIQCIELLARLDPKGTFNFTAERWDHFQPDSWCSQQRMLEKLEACREPCIEIFWHSSNVQP